MNPKHIYEFVLHSSAEIKHILPETSGIFPYQLYCSPSSMSEVLAHLHVCVVLSKVKGHGKYCCWAWFSLNFDEDKPSICSIQIDTHE